MIEIMETKVIAIDHKAMDEAVLQEAGTIIKNGGLVAFPTETVYGLGGDALNKESSRKIYAAKGRPSDNPLIVHIAGMEMIHPLVSELPESALKLADEFWPGPLTMILPKSDAVPYGTTGGLDTVAIRMPSHPVAWKLIHDSQIPLAAPSANTSGRPSPTRAEHVYDDLNGKIDMILDDGPVGIGIESTIVDLTGEVPMVLRPGYITREMLAEVLGEVIIDPAILDENKDKNFKPKAPGMKYKHYAPKGDLHLVEGAFENVVRKICELTDEKVGEGYKVGIIATEETKTIYEQQMAGNHAVVIMSIGTRKDEDTITHNLYDILRRMDGADVAFIYSESFGEGTRGQAIMNRLLKAAGYQQIHV